MPPTHISICLVDDNASVLRALSRFLKTVGLEPRCFLSPVAFVEYAKSHLIHVVILDIDMPEMTGFEVFEWLRFSAPKSRVIFITGTDHSVAHTLALNHGAWAVFAKPCVDDAFLATVLAAVTDLPTENRTFNG